MADDPKSRRTVYRYVELSQVGFEMVAPIVAGVLLGNMVAEVLS